MADMTVRPAVLRVTGTVTYRERITLPPGAVLTVRLSNVSKADAPAAVLALTAVEVAGQVPVPFELSVDSADVDDLAALGVSARLRSEVGTWISDTHTPVLIQGSGDVADLVVRRVDES
jgi:putative lipoprotein